MAHDEGDRGHRHPDAVAYLEGLGEEGAAMVRPYEGGHTRYWLEGGEVRSLDIAEDGPLPALLEAVSAEFGPQLPKLAADLASGVPDLDGVERALRDASLGGGAAALKLLFEQLDGALPAPRCEGCGRPMVRHGTGRRKSWLTRLGRVEVKRSHYYCRSCGKGCFPLDQVLGLKGSAFTPGMASVMAETVPLMSFGAASGHVANLAGVKASSSSLQRWSLALGEEALRFEREEAVDGKPLEPRMYLSIDGTGIPMRKEDVEGVAGKQEDGSAKTREAKLAVMYTAEGRDPETGAALKDRGSATFSSCVLPGIDQVDIRVCKVPHVARHHSHAARAGNGRDLTVGRLHGAAHCPSGGSDVSICGRGRTVERQYTVREAGAQHSFQSFRQSVASFPRRHDRESEPHFRFTDCRNVQARCSASCDPRRDSRVGPGPHQFGQHVRVKHQHCRCLNRSAAARA